MKNVNNRKALANKGKQKLFKKQEEKKIFFNVNFSFVY